MPKRVDTNELHGSTAAGEPHGPSPSAGRRPDSRRIRTALAYVPHVARRYLGCGLPFDELLAAGNLGLVEAGLRYQPARNVKFVTYADWWIRKSILKALEDQSGVVRLPRYRQEQLRVLQEGRRAWRRTHGSEPSTEELARATGMSYDEVARLRTLERSSLSLEDPALPGGARTLGDMLSSQTGSGPQDALLRRDLVRHIRKLVATLGDRERSVVLLRFGFGDRDPMTLREIGRKLGLSRERVRQLERRALIQLRNTL